MEHRPTHWQSKNERRNARRYRNASALHQHGFDGCREELSVIADYRRSEQALRGLSTAPTRASVLDLMRRS